MNSNRRRAVAALTVAGLLWGTTVPLSKVALTWLSPTWLTFVRFGLAAAILLVVTRARVRAVLSPAILASGAIGYGGSVVVQNAGISRTSVSHAALLIGAVPVMVAVIAAVWHRTVARPVAWAGFALSLAGVGLVTGGGGGGATAGGDGLVLVSLLLSATFTVAQVRLLRDRDPVAVTAVQFLGAAVAMLPVAVLTGGMPAAPASPGAAPAAVALAAGGTLLPFTLFAYGQSRVSAEVAGAFLNLEPLVGAVIGVVAFGNPAGPEQLLGGAAIGIGIALSSLPLLAGGRRPVTAPPVSAPPAPERPALHPQRQAAAPFGLTRRAVGERTPALSGVGQGQWPPGAVRLVSVGPRRHDLVDPVEGGVIQRDRGSLQQVLQLLHGPRPDNHRGDGGMRHGERDGQRGQRAADARGKPGELLDGVELGGVFRDRGIEPVRAERGAARRQVDRLALPVPAGQEAGGERAPGQHAHPVALADREHRCLGAAGEQRVGRLFGPEPQQPAPLGHLVRLDDFLGRKGRAAEGPDLPGVHEVAQRGQRLLDVGRVVRPVDLVQVDPVGLQPPQALLDLGDDPPPRVAAAVAAIAHREVHLGGQDDVIPAAA